MNSIYLDNAATTALRLEVINKMTEVLHQSYGNASSTHSFGRQAKALIEQSRKQIASYFKVSASEIIFTSGGTEANNLVLRSVVRDLGITEIITSKIEHHAVLNSSLQLAKEYGIKVSFVKLKKHGVIDYKDLEGLLKQSSKAIVSLMHINNEIGNILDINKVADLCKANKALFHTDAVQAVGHYNINLEETSIGFLAASAHKFHGPKGVGFCFIRKSHPLKPIIFGGEQERGFRAGTEAVHNIVAMAEALKLAYDNLITESAYISELKMYFIDKLKKNILGIHFNGEVEKTKNNTYTLVNVCLPLPAEKSGLLQFQLDLKGIACSKGSACQSGGNIQSHVLTEILNDNYLKRPSIRFSFSIYNTKEELDYVVGVLKEFINP